MLTSGMVLETEACLVAFCERHIRSSLSILVLPERSVKRFNRELQVSLVGGTMKFYYLFGNELNQLARKLTGPNAATIQYSCPPSLPRNSRDEDIMRGTDMLAKVFGINFQNIGNGSIGVNNNRARPSGQTMGTCPEHDSKKGFGPGNRDGKCLLSEPVCRDSMLGTEFSKWNKEEVCS